MFMREMEHMRSDYMSQQELDDMLTVADYVPPMQPIVEGPDGKWVLGDLTVSITQIPGPVVAYYNLKPGMKFPGYEYITIGDPLRLPKKPKRRKQNGN